MSRIDSFRGKYFFLSNFYLAPVVLDARIYPSVEHAYQAAKTVDLKDRDRIRSAGSPGIAKRIGRSVVCRSDWDKIKVDLMRALLWQKFSNSSLALKLLDTGDSEIVEGSTWGDTFWGVYRDRGENHLGRLLMEIREDLRH